MWSIQWPQVTEELPLIGRLKYENDEQNKDFFIFRLWNIKAMVKNRRDIVHIVKLIRGLSRRSVGKLLVR